MVWNKIKKQIADQTRPDIGHVPNLRTHGLAIKNTPGQPPEVNPPNIMWSRQLYGFGRGDYYVHTPDTYKRYIGYISNQYIGSSDNGGINEGAIGQWINIHYSTKLFAEANRQITVPINLSNCSYSIYVREDGEDYTLLNSQAIANPTFITLPLRSGIWTEIHLFVYFGRQAGMVSAFRNLANYVQAWREPDLSAPTAPTWRTPAVTTSLLDPVGTSVNTLFWELPADQDWAGNGIYRVELVNNPSVARVLPSGYFIPPQLSDVVNLHTITITGLAVDKFPHGSTITATGIGSANYEVLDTAYYAANLVLNNNFVNTNASGYPTDWQVVLDTGCTAAVSSGGLYGYSQVSGYAPSGVAHDCYIVNSGYIAIEPNETYTLSFSALTMYNNTEMLTDVLFYDSGQSPCASGLVSLTASGIDIGWQEYTFDGNIEGVDGYSFTIPSGCEYIRLRPHFGRKDANVNYPSAYADIRWAHETVHAGYSPINVDHTMVTISGQGTTIDTSGYNVQQLTSVHIADRARQSSDLQMGYVSWQDTGVRFGSTYQYRLDAYDFAHNRSGFSTTQTIITGDLVPPAHVTNLSGVPAFYAATFSWLSPTDEDYAGVQIWYTECMGEPLGYPVFVTSVNSLPNVYDQTTVGLPWSPDTPYTFELRAFDVNGNVNSSGAPEVTVSTHQALRVVSGIVTGTGTEFSMNVNRGVISVHDTQGNYSDMADGEMRYYQASGQQYYAYPKGIHIIPAGNLICGQENYFSALGLTNFATPPTAILIPARMMTFNSAAGFGSGIRQYIDLDPPHVTTSSIFPRAYIFAGATATPQTYTALPGMAIWSDGSATYDSNPSATNKESDAFIGCSGTWTSHKVTVNYKFGAPSYTDKKYPKGMPGQIILRLWSDIGTTTWTDDATNCVNKIISYYTDGQTYYGSITIDNPTLDNYCVKLDYYDRSLPTHAPTDIGLLSVQYINNGSASYELTGSGICGALLIL